LERTWLKDVVRYGYFLLRQIDKERITALAIANQRETFVGLKKTKRFSSAHHRGHLYRAILEGIAMEQSLASEAVEKATGERTEEFALIGGGARSELWRQIIADTSDKKVLNMSSDEASSLGAGISAAVAAGWFPSFEDAAKNMVNIKGITEPITQNAERYHNQLNRYREIYPAIREIGKRGT
jgi:sugar (pentulose or hexulose) kinase